MQLSTFQIILLSFAAAIAVGTALLCLPAASGEGYTTSVSDALFTATSAVCVTGLVVRDTYMGWSLFGRSVILVLIQIGGMGVVTIALLFATLSGKKISLFQRIVMKEAISAEKIGGILRMLSLIVRVTFLVELTGALLMLPVFQKEYGMKNGLGFAIFHSISAFCNAGFDLCGGKGAYSSLTSYASSIPINLVIMMLIIIGGIGFLTWDDIRRRHFRFRRYQMQTKVILVTTLILIVVPAIYFYLFEFRGETGMRRFLESFFQAVTPRTAGFNTMDLTSLSETGQILTIMLMLIGGAPGSTAGGMKVTTLAIMIAAASAVFRHNEDTNLFRRRIDNEIVRKASSLFFLYVIMFIGAAMAISSIEGLPILSCMFETASAIGTVGLSLGLTPELSQISRIILILLMFFGRVGGLTIIFATFRTRNFGMRLPKEDIGVG